MRAMNMYVYIMYVLVLKRGMTPNDIYLGCRKNNIPGLADFIAKHTTNKIDINWWERLKQKVCK